VIIPDSTMALYYMLKQTKDLIAKLEIDPARMLSNMEMTNGLIFSQAVLLALTNKGVSREDAYRLVQKNAMRVWEEKIPFQMALEGDAELMQKISTDELNEIFNLENRLKNVNFIFKQVGID
jgi:adenylosuccinate lyase